MAAWYRYVFRTSSLLILSHFATKGELASVYVDAGGTGVDIAAIVTTIHSTITVEFTTSLKEFDPSHMNYYGIRRRYFRSCHHWAQSKSSPRL
jgi:hypothetical protein